VTTRKRSFASLLSGGDLRTTGKADEAVRIVFKQPCLFDRLLRELWNQDFRIAMRAADALEKATRGRPQLLRPYKAELLGLAEETSSRELQWHLAQILPRLALSGREQRRVLETMHRYRLSDSAIVRTFALQALFELSAGSPQMRAAVVELLDDVASSGSAAERARARKLLAAASRKT
jgi:hypothetical protein